jgi:hypothetical protein
MNPNTITTAAAIAHEPWPNAIDLAATVAFFALVVLVPALGYLAMFRDFRTYLRSLSRVLVVARESLAGIPAWARDQTPRCVLALGLRMPCTEEDLKRAYRQRVKQLHPDHGGDQRRFLLLQSQFEQAMAFLVREAEEQQGDRVA